MLITFTIQQLPDVHMIGQTTRTGEWRKTPQSNPNHVMVILYKGACSFQISSEAYSLKAGDVLFLPANTCYTAVTKENEQCRFYYLHFTPPDNMVESGIGSVYNCLKNAQLEMQKNKTYGIPFMPQTNFLQIFLFTHANLGKFKSEVFTLLDKALSERNHFTISSKAMISLYLSQILVYITRNTIEMLTPLDPNFSSDGVMPILLQEAIDYIRQNLTCSITLKELCELYAVSEQHMIRLFQKHLGMPPSKYINHLRMSHAKDLIKYSSMTMKEIAYEIGLEDPYYFSKLFKKLEGITPSDFKSLQDSKLNV